MTDPRYNSEEVCHLLWAMRDNKLQPNDAERLNAMLLEDHRVREQYVQYMFLSGSLEWDGSASAKEQGADKWVDGEIRDSGFEVRRPENVAAAAVEPPGRIDLESRTSGPQFPAISPLPSPLPPSFVGGPVFSYMVASVVLCMMLLGAWAYKVTLVQPMSPGMAGSPYNRTVPERIVVGYITDMKDCRWNDEGTGTMVGASVPMGRNYALSAGLLEITYADGARVILEGPCDYTTDSRTGGRLQSGKLVARVEKKVASAKPQAANPQPPAPSPSTLHPPLFTVSTPTAVVTDLGTEFGVEVGANGDTTSHVFRGSVRVQVIGEGGTPEEGPRKELVLHADESARVEKVGRVRETHQGQPATEVVRFTHPTTPPAFARRMRTPPKQLDLLDIVAGGNGLGNRRERGIDPASGLEDPVFMLPQRKGNNQFQNVSMNPLIDGVFLPDGLVGAVQLDSAMHAYDGFPPTTRTTAGGIWARAAKISRFDRGTNRWRWVYTMLNDEQFMPERRGLLCMHANSGITFDLTAMRKIHEGARPARFRATAGLADAALVLPDKDPQGMVDLWVFVDGRLELQRKALRPKDGTIDVNIELGPDDGFLTLVVTDNNKLTTFDWAVFGDPVLKMNPIESDTPTGDKPTANESK